ncbi:MAG: M20 family metallopeptidase [Promethearchaeota archaeon]|jgi:aminobenzoyl-glutamate utilization protein B
MFKQAIKSVKANQDLLIDVSDQIWEFAELGLEEFKSSKLLIKTLSEAGFSVKSDVKDMPTAFFADYGNGKPVIGILGEYDALPGLSQKVQPTREVLVDGAPGHGCGHNLLGVASLGAVLSIKEAIDSGEVNGTIRYYGCPAEEKFNAKGYMIREGLFDDVDIAMTWHPSNFNMVNLMSALAINSVVFKFHGRTAHAAGDPQNGRSALDAVELMNIGANYMREHMISDARLHYVITHGGDVPNVVPAEAEVHYFVRSPERHQVEELYARLVNIAKGATLMTETTMEIAFVSGMYNTMYTNVVSDVISNAMRKVGPPRFNKDDVAFANELKKSVPRDSLDGYYKLIPPEMKEFAKVILSQPLNKVIIPPMGKGKVMPGSTDVGDVSWKVPLGEFGTACEVMGSPGHSWQNVVTSGMSIGHKGMLTAAKILAISTLDFMKNPDLVKKASKEHEQVHKEKPYKSPLPDGLKPPHKMLKN